MVKKDRINLIEEFRNNQKGNDYIILTTYTFDPIFFDNFLLRELLNNSPSSDIVVLIDSEQYEKSYENFTNITGNQYHLIPIFVERGVFHPKIFIFLSKTRITYYLGSANLTLQGFTKNAELISKTEYSSDKSLSDIKEITEILKRLNQSYIYEKKVLNIFNRVIEEILPTTYNENTDLKIIHNFDEPIISQLIKELYNYKFEEMEVLAPFFSGRPLVLEKILRNLNIKKVIILLPNNHNLDSPELYQNLANKEGIEIEFKEAEFRESNRQFHSKIMSFKGEKNFLIIGSPNLTISALLKVAEKGNMEFAILFRDLNFQEIFDPIKTKEITDISQIQAELTQNNIISNKLKIFYADYEDITRVLNVKIDSIIGNVTATVLLANKSLIKETLKLNNGKFTLKIPESYPTEIEIILGDKKAKRRIFYDRNYLFKNIKKMGNISWKELDDKIFYQRQIDISDILPIVDGISDNNQPLNETYSSKKKSNKKIKTPIPSSINKQDAVSLLRDLNRIHRFIAHKKRLSEAENSLKEKELKISFLNYSYNLNKDQIEKLLIKIIEVGNNIFLKSTKKLEGENEDTRLIRSQSIFLNLFMHLCIKSIENDPGVDKTEIFKKFKCILESNLINISKEECSKDSLIKLFSRLILLNYSFDKKESYKFLSNLFDYKDLLNEESYKSMKQFVKETLENSLNIEFDTEEFIEDYANLLEYVFDSSTIEPGLEFLIGQINQEENDYQKAISKLAAKICGINEDTRFSIDKGLLNKTKKVLIE